MFFLVSPGIFQRYVAECPHPVAGDVSPEDWRQHQRLFERLDIHLKRPNGQNIWTCKVQGPRSTSSLNGYLLREAEIISSQPPANNPFLKLSS
ncbi:hypothetical protein D3C77_265280 [compost metagenome]